MKSAYRNQLLVFLVCLSIVLFATGIFNSQRAQSDEGEAPALSDALPVGTIVAWAGDLKSIPPDWRLCNGRSLNRGKFRALFDAIGTSWGGDGSRRFNLPDLRGRFLRGVDGGTGRDPDAGNRKPSKPGGNSAGVGSVQNDSFQNHTHNDNGHVHVVHSHPGADGIFPDSAGVVFPHNPGDETENSRSGRANLTGAVRFGTESNLRAGEETRPINAYVYWIIKVK